MPTLKHTHFVVFSFWVERYPYVSQEFVFGVLGFGLVCVDYVGWFEFVNDCECG